MSEKEYAEIIENIIDTKIGMIIFGLIGLFFVSVAITVRRIFLKEDSTPYEGESLPSIILWICTIGALATTIGFLVHLGIWFYYYLLITMKT
jgi:hypothetical protein